MGICLVVEDNADLRSLYRIAIKNAGHTPFTAENGRQALDLLSQMTPHPDLVILDLMMPVMDGWQFLEEINKAPQWRDIPVIVCSASPDKAPAESICLRKPLSLEQLRSLLATHCANNEDPALEPVLNSPNMS